MRIKMLLAVDKDLIACIHHRWYITFPVQCTVQSLTRYSHHLTLQIVTPRPRHEMSQKS